MKCKECNKETQVEIKEATISIRDTIKDAAIEIVVDNVCMDCLLKALNGRF